VTHAVLPPDTLERISSDSRLAEQYRQAMVNHQVADLLDVRALSAATPGQAAAWRHRAAQRRAMGDRILQQVLKVVT
jgi:hypothetical protein